jgi:DNA topoisomerase I
LKNKQLGTATYLIDKLALRVGNEKGEDEADTQGCCSLRVEHIETLPDDYIKLDFLGKDSMRYTNTVKVHPSVWKDIELFRKGKKLDDDLFDKIDAQALNDYLKSQM